MMSANRIGTRHAKSSMYESRRRAHVPGFGSLGRKEYVMLASTLRRQGKNRCTKAIAEDLARELAQDNPRFDRERFMSAALGFQLGDGGAGHYLWKGAKWYVGIGAVYSSAWVIHKIIARVRGMQYEPAQIAEEAVTDLLMWPLKAYGTIVNIGTYGLPSVPIVGAFQGIDGLGQFPGYSPGRHPPVRIGGRSY